MIWRLKECIPLLFFVCILRRLEQFVIAVFYCMHRSVHSYYVRRILPLTFPSFSGRLIRSYLESQHVIEIQPLAEGEAG